MLSDLLGPELEELIQAGDTESLRLAIAGWDPADLADAIEGLPIDDQVVIFGLLSREEAARVFEHMERAEQGELLQTLPAPVIGGIVEEMAADDRTAMLEELPETVTDELLEALPPDEQAVAQQLLAYPENSVGRLMTPDFLALSPGLTTAAALEEIRRVGHDKETVDTIFLIDSDGHAVGDVGLGAIVLADSRSNLADLVDHAVTTISAKADQEEAYALALHYDREVIAVVDDQGRMVGIVTFDDLMDVAEEEATEDIHKMAGVAALEHPYFGTKNSTMIRKRLVWLIALFFGQFLTASVMKNFEGTTAMAALLIFVPLVLATGGNSGNQSASLVIRGLGVGEMELRDTWRVLGRELLVGHAMGLVFGTMGFVFALILGQPMVEALALALALVGVVVCGSLVGSSMPFVLRRFGFDPAVSSSPFISTFCDVLGLFLFFNLALIILGMR